MVFSFACGCEAMRGVLSVRALADGELPYRLPRDAQRACELDVRGAAVKLGDDRLTVGAQRTLVRAPAPANQVEVGKHLRLDRDDSVGLGMKRSEAEVPELTEPEVPLRLVDPLDDVA